MRRGGREIIPVPRTQHIDLVPDGQFQPPANDHAAFLALMGQVAASGIAPGFIVFVQELQVPTRHLRADQQIPHPRRADVDVILAPEYRGLGGLQLKAKERRKVHRNTVEDLFQHGDGRLHRHRFNLRNRAGSHARAPRQFALRKALGFADHAQTARQQGVGRGRGRGHA